MELIWRTYSTDNLIMRQNVEFLRQEGPSTVEEMPGRWVNVQDRADGVRRIALRKHSSGEGGGRGQQTYVYYLEDHDLRDVVRKYLEENPGLLEQQTKQGLSRMFGDHSNDIQDAWRAIGWEYDVEISGGAGTGKQDPGPCSLCGAEDFQDLPTHLLDCDGPED